MNALNKIGFALSLISLLTFLGIPRVHGQGDPGITDGIYDARHIDLSADIIALSGNWKFYPSAFVLPEELSNGKKIVRTVPSVWNDFNREKKGTGYGTYSLKIILPEKMDEVGLSVPQLYSSYSLFVNDSLVARNGVIGKSRDESAPEWKPQVVIFSTDRDTIDIILQISNFHHYKGGIREPILFGPPTIITDHFNRSLLSTIALTGFIVMITVSFLFLYLIKQRDTEMLYFALFCLGWSVRLMFTDIYAITHFVDFINWNFQLRAEYISLYLTMIFSTLLLSKLFPDLKSKTFLILVIIINILFVGFTLFTEPFLFTHWLNLYIGMAVIVLIYSTIIIIRALLQDQTGVWSLIAAVILTILMMTYDVVAFNGIVPNDLIIKNIGYGLIFISLSVGILQHVGVIKGEKPVNRKLSIEDFYRKS